MIFEGMICDKFFENIEAENEQEATKKIINRFREMCNTMTDEELESEFGVIVW